MRLKDTMDFVNFIGKAKISQGTILVSMDVTSLYTNIPQEEGITTVCRKHTRHSKAITLIYRHTTSKKYFNLSFKKILSSLLETIIFRPMELQWIQKWPLHLQTSLWPILTKMISQSKTKPIEWRRFIDDIFSLWDCDKKEIYLFIEQANNFHPTIKFTAEISENETTKGYRPEARGYVSYCPRALRPRATHEGNKSHNHELKADKRLIFTLARIPQGNIAKTYSRKMALLFIFLLFFNTPSWDLWDSQVCRLFNYIFNYCVC